MPVHNADIAEIFNRVADLLEIQGANPFRVRAYRNAARTVGGMSKSVSDMGDDGKSLSDLPGIGKDLAGKIKEIVETGRLSQLEELEKEVPPELHTVLKIPGLGPKKVKVLHDELNIDSVADLTGRLINERDPYDLDMEKAMEAAKERGCFMELNAQPERLDLNDINCKMAKESGVKVAVSTDAHSIDDLNHMRFGVRRAHCRANKGIIRINETNKTCRTNITNKVLEITYLTLHTNDR